MLTRRPPGSSCAWLALALVCWVSAIQVTPGSPCASLCLDKPNGDSTDRQASSTNTSDVVCSDIDFFSSSAGPKFKDCVSCLQTSRQVDGGESDIAWFLYNLRFASDVCLFGFPSPARNKSSPCDTDSACRPLHSALEIDISSPTQEGKFGYCTANNSVFRGEARKSCNTCLQATGDSNYLSNFLIALEAGCQQRPGPGALLGLSGSLFTELPVNITDPPSNEAFSSQSDSKPVMPVGTIVGISVAAGLLLLGGAVLFIIYWRRLRRFDREDELMRGGDEMYRPYTGRSSITTTNRGPYFPNDPKDAIFESQVTVNNGSYFKPGSVLPGHHEVGVYDDLPGYTALPDGAMPAHPAYIPRAMIRRNNAAPTTGSQLSSNLAFSPSSLGAHTQNHHTQNHLAQGSHLDGAGPASRLDHQPSRPPPSHTPPAFTRDRASSTQRPPSPPPPPPPPAPAAAMQPSTNVPPPPPGPPPPKVPSLILPSVPRMRQQRKRYSPPRISDGGGIPIPGREGMAITGPLAFPEQAFPEQHHHQARFGDEPSAADRRTFRERAASSPVVAGGRRRSGRSSVLLNLFGGGDDRGAEGSRRRYDEVPLDSGKDDLYG